VVLQRVRHQSREKKRRLAKQTVASLSAQGPDLDCSRLAVMNANNDPLGVRSAGPFRWQMRREGLLASASSPTGFRHLVALEVSTLTFRDVQRLWWPQCKRVSCRGKQATEPTSAAPRISMSAFGTKRTSVRLQISKVWFSDGISIFVPVSLLAKMLMTFSSPCTRKVRPAPVALCHSRSSA
jgi:hypothetical protein